MSLRGRTAALANVDLSDKKACDAAVIAAVSDFSDIIALAKDDTGFKQAAVDKQRNISMFTKPVAESPIHMMKARAVMPCGPKDLLGYLELDRRQMWDDHFIRGHVLNESTTGAPAEDASSLVMGGPANVWFKYMAFKSPMPVVVQKRDFELVVGEQLLKDGTAVLKALSPPMGRCHPQENGFVRGVIEISGFVAEPIGKHSCRVTYVALVDPKGMVPPVAVNILVGKQTATLAQMQRVIGEEENKKHAAASAAKKGTRSSAKGRGFSSSPSSSAESTTPLLAKL